MPQPLYSPSRKARPVLHHQGESRGCCWETQWTKSMSPSLEDQDHYRTYRMWGAIKALGPLHRKPPTPTSILLHQSHDPLSWRQTLRPAKAQNGNWPLQAWRGPLGPDGGSWGSIPVLALAPPGAPTISLVGSLMGRYLGKLSPSAQSRGMVLHPSLACHPMPELD